MGDLTTRSGPSGETGWSGASRRDLLRVGVGCVLGSAVLGAVAGCGNGADGTNGPPIQAANSSLDPYFPGHGAGGFLVNRCSLDLTYVPDSPHAVLSGTVTTRILPYTALSGLTLDLADGLRVKSVSVDGVPAAFSRPAPGAVHIEPRSPLPSARMADVAISYSGVPRPVQVIDVGAVGWQTAGPPAAPGSAGPLSLPIGAPTWYPCADHPTLKPPYQFSVTAPARLSVLANGTLLGRRPAPGRQGSITWTYLHDSPMASYLTAIQIGDFVLDTAPGPGGVQIRNAYPARLAQQAAYDLGRQARMIEVFNGYFGAYPFDVFGTAVLDGLPVPGATAQTYALVASSALDGNHGPESQIAYSLGAQWFGASVSVGTWADIWLTTGFATYAQWLWTQESGGPTAQSMARMAMARLAGLPADLVLCDPGAQRILDPRVSLRGACFLQALRAVMGDQTFFRLLALWASLGRGGFATTGDFVQTVSNAYSAQELTNFINAWVYSPALPALPAS